MSFPSNFWASKMKWLLAAPLLFVGGFSIAEQATPPGMGKLQAVEQRVTALLKRAESKKDMVMINCVSDKLMQIRGYIAVGNAALQSASAEYAQSRYKIVEEKVITLGTEAEGCIGEDVNYVGATRVDLEIDPGIPQDDPTIPPAYGNGTVSDGCLSCYYTNGIPSGCVFTCMPPPGSNPCDKQ